MNKIEIAPFDTPWEVACMLINAKYERDSYNMESFFKIDDLRRIGEHIINYCNTEGVLNDNP